MKPATHIYTLFTKLACLILLFTCYQTHLSAGLVITRNEIEIISKEIYHQNYYAELINDRIVTLWDFNESEMTLINHQLQIYTTVDFETFTKEMQRQNQAQIDSELRRIPPDTRERMRVATLNAYQRMRPHFTLAGTIDICGYKSTEYHIYNGNVLSQKLWISKDLQDRIDNEVNPLYIKQVENVLKENRQKYFETMKIHLDPIGELVEALEQRGYIMRRIDYGNRTEPDPDFEAEMENYASKITDISEINIDPTIFTYHQRYRRMTYSAYQVAVMRSEMQKNEAQKSE